MTIQLGQIAPDFEQDTTVGRILVTPVNWQPGERAIALPSINDEDAKARFPQGWDAQKPYLRYVERADEA